MWIANIISKKINPNGFIEVTVTYEDGTNTRTEINQVRASKDLEAIITNNLKQLNSLDIDNVVLGTFTPVDTTQKDAELKIYVELKQKYAAVQEDIKNNLIDINDPAVVQLIIELKAAYKPEYSGL
jgi:hypothetical protein